MISKVKLLYIELRERKRRATGYYKDINSWFESLLKSRSKEEALQLGTEILQFATVSEIKKVMKEKNFTEKRLARKMKMSQKNFEALFSADKILTLKQLTLIGNILNISIKIPLNEKPKDSK